MDAAAASSSGPRCAALGLDRLSFLVSFSFLLSLSFLLAGTFSTISAKAAQKRGFNHPLVQTWFMFIGEASCLIVLKFSELAERRRRVKQVDPRPLLAAGEDGHRAESSEGLVAFTALQEDQQDLEEEGRDSDVAAASALPMKPAALSAFFVPAMLDVVGSFLVFVGLRLTPPSTFMMLRCMNVPFTALLSSMVTRTRPPRHKIIGTLVVTLAVLMVGYASTLNAPEDDAAARSSARLARYFRDKGAVSLFVAVDDAGQEEEEDGPTETVSDQIAGTLLIILSSFATACQMVWEERVFRTADVAPLKMVGMEGIFGIVATSLLLGIALWVKQGDSAVEAVREFRKDEIIFYFILLNTLCVAFLNALGAAVTKILSAAHRSILDASRIIIVWTFSVAIGWESSVNALQIIGFLFLMFGVAVFNGLVGRPATTAA